MPQICDIGQIALLPLRRKACWGLFHPKILTASAGVKPATLGTRGQHANHQTTEAATSIIPTQHSVFFCLAILLGLIKHQGEGTLILHTTLTTCPVTENHVPLHIHLSLYQRAQTKLYQYSYFVLHGEETLLWHDIFNCNWVATRWQ
jgi:hypothetical protein